MSKLTYFNEFFLKESTDKNIFAVQSILIVSSFLLTIWALYDDVTPRLFGQPIAIFLIEELATGLP